MQAIRQADGSIDYHHYRTETARLRQQAKGDAVTAVALLIKRGFFSLVRRSAQPCSPRVAPE